MKYNNSNMRRDKLLPAGIRRAAQEAQEDNLIITESDAVEHETFDLEVDGDRQTHEPLRRSKVPARVNERQLVS